MKIVRVEGAITKNEILREIDNLRKLGHDIADPEDAQLQYIIDVVEADEQGFYDRNDALDYVANLIFETIKEKE